MRAILLITIGFSVFLSANFTKSGNIVTDSKTGLEWQDNDNNSIEKTWQEAIDYCEALTLDTHDDWRLPNINELKTLIDRSKEEPASVDGFEYVKLMRYWSSTSYFNGIDDQFYSAWTINFERGDIGWNDKKISIAYVRCVRDGQ